MQQPEDDIELVFYILLSGDVGAISGPYLASDDLSQILTSDDGSQTLTPN